MKGKKDDGMYLKDFICCWDNQTLIDSLYLGTRKKSREPVQPSLYVEYAHETLKDCVIISMF